MPSCLSVKVPAFAFLLAATLPAQFTPNLYQAMRWRQIGPFRAGRVTAVAGIPGNAATYYMGTPGGGVWKTIDGGVVWTPIFDQVETSSIGAVAVAISQPDVVYVGTGDVSMVGGSVNQGDGVYRSADAGKTWRHIGLDETEHIGNMWVDPHNPDVVVVAALGRTYSKNEQRGVFKTIDGGKTWKKVLYKDDITGAVDLVFAPGNSKIGYAAMMEHYTRPGARNAIESTGAAGVYKTSDGGDTWTELTEDLPGGRLGRIGLATSKDGQKVFATSCRGRRRTRSRRRGRSLPVGRRGLPLDSQHAGFTHPGQWLLQPRVPGPQQFRCSLRGPDLALQV